MAKHPNKPKKRRVTRQPFQQGDLDGLCGVYSIVNAVRTLCPEVDVATAEHLFDLLMRKLLRTAGTPSLAVTWGIGRLALMSLVEEAIEYMLDDFDIQISMRRLPQELRKTSSRSELLNHLEKTVSPTCVAIIGLAGKYSHWTVAAQITSLSLRLVDSSRMRSLSRARCTVGRTRKRHQISPMHVILLERKRS